MKKLLFTIALIFALLISCEKEEEIKQKPWFSGKWTTYLTTGENNWITWDIIQTYSKIEFKLDSSSYNYLKVYKTSYTNQTFTFEYGFLVGLYKYVGKRYYNNDYFHGSIYFRSNNDWEKRNTASNLITIRGWPY